MHIFDLHTHIGLTDDECDLFEAPSRDAFAAWIAARPPGAPPEVACAVLPPTFYAYPNGLADTQRLNDLVLAYRAAHSETCRAAFGVVEPHYGEAGLAEIDRLADAGASGLVWRHRAHGAFADVPIMSRYVERAARRGLLPMLHVTPLSGNEAVWRVWNLAEQFPEVPIVALGALSDWDQLEHILANAGRAPNLRYDLAELDDTLEGLGRLVEVLGAGRLVYGSGAHHRRDAARFARGYARIARSGLAEEVKERILWGNAAILLGLER